MNRNHKKNITSHSIRRSRERTGVTKNQLPKMATRARTEGIRREYTCGELRALLNKKSYKTSYYVMYYANAIYVFRNLLLITVMDIDEKYEKNLINYVTIPAFLTYKQNRYKRRSNHSELEKEANRQAKQKLKEEMTEYLSNDGLYKYLGFHVTTEYEGYINLQALKPNISEEKKNDIKRYVKNRYGLKTMFFEKNISISKRTSITDEEKRECKKLFNFVRKAITLEHWQEVWDTLEDTDYEKYVGTNNLALTRYFLLELSPERKKIKETAASDLITYLNDLQNEIFNQSKKYYIDDQRVVAQGIAYKKPILVTGYLINSTDLITEKGILYKDVKYIQRVKNVTTSENTEQIKTETTYEFVDLWGQVQWQEDFSS